MTPARIALAGARHIGGMLLSAVVLFVAMEAVAWGTARWEER
jgi:hypothetical protein